MVLREGMYPSRSVPLHGSHASRFLTHASRAPAHSRSRHLQHRRRAEHLQRRHPPIQHPSRGVSTASETAHWLPDIAIAGPALLRIDSHANFGPASSSTPPGEQAALERWSVAFFTRPSDTAILRALSERSALVAQAAARAPAGRFETGTNAKDWIARRVGGLRYNNYKVRSLPD